MEEFSYKRKADLQATSRSVSIAAHTYYYITTMKSFIQNYYFSFLTLALAAGSAIAKENLRGGAAAAGAARDLELAIITGFTLMDTSSNTVTEIGEIDMRDLVDLAETGKSLSLRADTRGEVGSVTFTYGNDDTTHTEKVTPFAMGGNNGDKWNPVDYLSYPGVKVVFAETEAGYSTYISFAVIDSSPTTDEPTPSPTNPPPSFVTKFTLINADTDTEIGEVGMRDYFDLAEIGTSLSVRAETTGPVDWVIFNWSDGNTWKGNEHKENVAPFAMNGNVKDDYFPVDYLSTPGVKVVFVKTDSGSETYVSFALGDSNSE